MSSNSRGILWRGRTLLVGLVLVASAPAWALTGIHNEIWYPSSGRLRYQDANGNCTELSVQFEAVVTASDVANGIRFSICERDVGEVNDPLIEAVLQPTPERPAAGTHVLATVYFFLSCNGAGGLIGCRVDDWHIAWCDAAGMHVARGQSRGGRRRDSRRQRSSHRSHPSSRTRRRRTDPSACTSTARA